MDIVRIMMIILIILIHMLSTIDKTTIRIDNELSTEHNNESIITCRLNIEA